jgi:CPA1 family monovalent cation:H+ antiporter
VTLLASALVVVIVAERIRIAPAVLLVAAGVVAASLFHLALPFQFGPAVLYVFLPPLIFEAAWSIELRALRPQLDRLAVMAFPGAVVCAIGVAAATYAIGGLALPSALVLGAMLAATDPLPVVAVFRGLAAPAEVRALVEGESIMNDGVAVALYGIALAVVAGAAASWPAEIVYGIAGMIGGIAIGAICGTIVWAVLRAIALPEYEVLATVALAYAAYVIAVSVHCSGIFATAAGAIALRALLVQRSHIANRGEVDIFWTVCAAIASAIVFLSAGLTIELPRAFHEPMLVMTAIAVVLVLRVPLALLAGATRADRALIFFAGMRGALTLALALALPSNVPQRAEIIDVVFATVLVTLVIQGAPLRALARRLYPEVPDEL